MIDPDIDANLKLERESLDPAVRKKASQDLNKIMGSKAEAIWANWVVWANIAKTNVHGLEPSCWRTARPWNPNYFPGFLNLHSGVEVLSRSAGSRARPLNSSEAAGSVTASRGLRRHAADRYDEGSGMSMREVTA